MPTVLASGALSAASSALILAGSVSLQNSTPGAVELGHTNISGNSLAGRFGANTLPSLARIQVKETGTLQGVRSESNSGVAVFGKSTASTGLGAGGYFTSSSVGGRGMVGDALSTSGNTVGGLFFNRSNGGGVAVWGRAIGAGTATGVLGEVVNANGTALAATNSGSGNGMTAGTSDDSLQTKGDLPRHQYATGNASAMVPIAYGLFSLGGGVFYGTPNWSCTHPSVGNYDVDVSDAAFSRDSCVVIASSYGSGGTEVATIDFPDSGDFRISIRDGAGTLQDSAGFFVVYRLAGLGAFPMGQPNQQLPFGGDIEKWEKKDPKSFAEYSKRFRAALLESTRTDDYAPPVDNHVRP